MQKTTVISAFFAVGLGSLPALSGCQSRTAAATQPTPAAFDATKSDERALEAVDAMVAGLGGAQAWEGMKQLRWDLKYYQDGELKIWLKHAWDRWNGRHRAELIDMPSYEQAKAEGRPEDTKSGVAMYNLFDRESGTVMYAGQQLPSTERKKWIDRAYERWQEDAYRLTIHYKLRDPGVKLEHTGEQKDVEGLCLPACDSIRVTFDPGVGTDTYYVNINTESRMPEILEQVVEGDKRIGYSLSGWTEAGGLKFPTEFQNLGLEGEKWVVENIQVGEPEDSLYIPQVK